MKTLLVGLGNPLRRDDAVGARAAEVLAGEGWPAQALLQPLPEHALVLADLERVVFVDADREAAPGEIRLRRAAPAQGSESSHGFDVPALLALCQALAGRTPEAWLLSMGVADLGHGESLSPVVEAALPALVARARALL